MVSKCDYLKVLENYLRTSKVELLSFQEKPISENVEGFLGEHFKLIIKYKQNNNEKESVFFVKNKPTENQVQLEMADQLNVFNKEIFIYDNLLKQFEELGYDINFAPKSYYCVPGKSLILEDVTLKGFSIIDRRELFTLEQMKQVLKCLAMYHAAGFALERTKSKELGRHFCLGEEYKEYFHEQFFVQYIDKNSYSMKWWNGLFKTIDVLIDYLAKDSIYKSNLRKMIKNYEFGKSFVTETNISKTTSHGDLWSNNMLFKYENNSAIDCRLVDFQVCRYFYPSFDVLLAILCNTDAETRRNYLEELFEYYYHTLAAYLEKYGYDAEKIHPKKDFYETIDLVKMEAVMQMLLVNIIIYLPKDKVTKYAKEESGINAIMFENDVLATEAFKIDELYRKNVCEAIYEMRNILIHKTT